MSKKREYSKFKKDEDLIKSLYIKNKKVVKHTAEEYCKIREITFNDAFRRAVSHFIGKYIDDSRNKKKRLDDAIEKSKHFQDAVKRKVKRGKEYYIIGWAQNQTDVHSNLISNIESLSKHLNNAPIIVIPGRYRNPTSLFSNRDYDTWDERVKDYLVADRHKILKKLTVLADIKISSTTSQPLAQKELITRDSCCIVGHPRVHMKSMLRHISYEPKVMWTTGALTLPNYTDTNSGKVAEEHHTYGFCLVEKDGEEYFHCRQVTADKDGNFYDIKWRVEDGEVYENKEIDVAVLGDVHVRKHNQNLIDYIELNILKKYKPRYTIIHDLADMESTRKHTMKDPIMEHIAHKKGTVNIDAEIEDIKTFCKNWIDYNLTIVSSNHNDHLDQYIRSIDWRKDPINGLTYTKYASILMNELAPKGILAYELDEEFKEKILTLGRTDSFKYKSWELSLHGDMGANGARGSNKSFTKLPIKVIKGHDHTLERIDGTLSCGTCTNLFLGYNQGLTNWMQGIAIILPNGKAQQLVWVNNKLFK